MTRKSLVLSIVMVVLFAIPAVASEMSIAVIDANKILNSSKEGAEARSKMENRYKELQKKISSEESSIKEMKEDIDKKKIILGKEKLKEKEDEFKAKVLKFQKLVNESQKEMKDKEGAFTKVIIEKIKVIVAKVAKEKKYDLVIDVTGGLVYFNETLDITGDVLAILDKEYEGGKNKN